jgi:hypothetical protein
MYSSAAGAGGEVGRERWSYRGVYIVESDIGLRGADRHLQGIEYR